MNVQATHVFDLDDADYQTLPGAFEYFSEGTDAWAGMIYVCPCGCGRTGALPFRKPDGTPRPSWLWDGNEDAPTLEPSVHHLLNGVTHWHGYLRAGVWESCG